MIDSVTKQACTIEMTGADSARLGGELTFRSTPGLYKEMESYFREDSAVQRVDLSDVTAIDSAGLALLLEWQASRRNGQARLVMENAPASLVSLARLCDALELLKLSGRGGVS